MTPPRAAVVGRTWRFPEPNINSDLILPSTWTQLRTEEEQAQLLFQAYRPGWIDQVTEGDILVGGKNFGTGSGRPGASLMRRVGVIAVVAESINDLFYRNCINAAILPLECSGVLDAVDEGDLVEVDATAGRFRNTRTEAVLPGTAVPGVLLDIIAKGGLIAQLRADGLIH